MSHKSRENWSAGICLDTCQCRQCRGNKPMVNKVYPSESTSNVTHIGIINVMHHSPLDGSRLEVPMSKTYMEHIRSRNSNTLPRMKERMSQYGA